MLLSSRSAAARISFSPCSAFPSPEATQLVNATFNLASGDSLSLTASGSIVPMSGHGVFGANANALTIEGDIITRSGTGVLLGTSGFGVNTLSVLGTGLIMGLNGVSVNGSLNLTNAGNIIATQTGSIALGINGGRGVIANSGLISGDGFGIFTSGLGAPGFEITNTGLVQSGGTGIRLTTDNNTVMNFGTIDAGGIALQTTEGFLTRNITVNWGTILSRTSAAISTADGNDLITNRGSIVAASASVSTGRGDDVFDNSLGGVVSGAINMGDSDDLVIAGVGAENINGDAGNDTVSYANSPKKMLINLTGQVTTDADGVTDTLSGIENAVGSVFDDAVYGDGANNILDGGPGGFDQIFGGGGSDTVSYASAGRAVLINLAGQVTADGVETDTLSSIENAIGSRFNDTIHGDDGNNVLDGGTDGSDQIFGGLGSDTVSYATSARAVLINLPGQVTSDGINTDTLSSIESAIGSQFADSIIGTAGANALNGGAGNDTITGGLGNDLITGGRGNDVLDGGGNNDIFVFENASFPTSLAALYSGNDAISSFEKIAGAAGDQVQLQAPGSGSWSVVESSGNTVFTLVVLGSPVATVTVTGVTGMANG